MGQAAERLIRIIETISPAAHKVLELIDKGDIQEARAQYENAKRTGMPSPYETDYLEALLLHRDGKTPQAIDLLFKMAETAPGFLQAIFNLGVMLEEAGRFDEALNVYNYILDISPKYSQARFNMAHIYQRAGHVKDAERHYRQFLEQTPYHSGANCNLGAILIDQGRFNEALPYCEKAVMLELDNPNARNNCGIVYAQRGDFAKAEKAFRHALKIKPDYESAQRNLDMLEKQKSNPAATTPSAPAQAVQSGNAHLAARELEQAEQAYRKALLINPDHVDALINLGMCLNLMRRYADAEGVLKRAVSIEPGNPDAHCNLGNLYRDQQHFDEALAAYEKSIKAQAGFFEGWYNKGLVHEQLGQHDAALAAFKKALELSPAKILEANPQHAAALSRLIIEQQQLCLWDRIDEYKERLEAVVRSQDADLRQAYEGFLVSTLQTISADPALQRRSAEQSSKLNFGAVAKAYDPARPLPCDSRKGGKIRIAYVSADFHQHATAYLIAGMFERHDRSRFEIYAYSYGPGDKSAIRQRIEKGVDRFIDVAGISDKQAAEHMVKNGIDIAVDLKGYTQNHRMGILASRPAPLQAHYLGYPGTIGAPFIDYFLADAVSAPASMESHFSEKLVRVPGSYQINDDKRLASESTPSRKECGLPEEGFVFASLNQNYKITPQQFDIWMRLLSQVQGSVLWLYLTNDAAADNLRMEAKKRGIDPSRLVFARYKPLADHLARCRHIDLFLDTYPVNAHTTASDALWMGIPLVTYAGETFVSRVAASLVSAAGLPELVTSSPADYEALALKLAQDPTMLSALRQKAQAAKNSPLFDTAATTKAIEQAYLQMIERHKQGKLPENFSV